MMQEKRDLSFEERLNECGLTILETMRLREDKSEFFFILSGYENIDINSFVLLKKVSSTTHDVTLVKDQSV